METIFDHNISGAEIQRLQRIIPGRTINDKNRYENSISGDICCADLYRLYNLRGDKDKAERYLYKIKDPTLRYLLKDF